ncbi:hypothetical protein C8039_10820 [Halogeometricum sp. wsp3]|nr:hypothetical protein C8039_10820 [Halogeometricum sp. wsp3]
MITSLSASYSSDADERRVSDKHHVVVADDCRVRSGTPRLQRPGTLDSGELRLGVAVHHRVAGGVERNRLDTVGQVTIVAR